MWPILRRVRRVPFSSRDGRLSGALDAPGVQPSGRIRRFLLGIGCGIVSRVFVFLYFAANARNDGLLGKGAWAVWRARLFPIPPAFPPEARPLWLHIAGPGDARAAAAFVRELRAGAPDCPVYLTCGTRPAMEYIHGHPESFGHCRTGWLPIDTPLVVRRILRRLRPRAFVAMQGEFWPALLEALWKAGIPSIVLRVDFFDWDEQKEFPRCIKPLYRHMLSRVAAFSVRHPLYRERLIRFGVPSDRVWCGGDYRSEVLPPPDDAQQARYRELLKPGSLGALVVWAGPRLDELRRLDPFLGPPIRQGDFRLLIAPAELDACADIERLLRARGYPLWKRSDGGCAPPGAVMILDTHGELFQVYSVADAMIAGDSFYACRSEGRNFWEALVQGAPVVYGAGVPATALTCSIEEAGVARRLTVPSLLPEALASLLQKRLDRSRVRAVVETALAACPKAARTDVACVLGCIARTGQNPAN